jgi:hypothetical protein
MTEINVSAHTPFHTQVNNVYYPLSTCNTTSAIMWLLDCGIPFTCPSGMQPEDHLTTITETPEAREFMHSAAPWAFDAEGRATRSPREVHVCLAWAVNKMVGREVMRFRLDATYQELIAELANGNAALLSGIFTRRGHVVCLVGVRTTQDRAELVEARRVRVDCIKGFIIDDPYGDYFKGYHDCRGNDVFFPVDDIDRLARELYQNRKWAHVKVA